MAAKTYFYTLEEGKQSEVNESAENTLRATLFSLQVTLLQPPIDLLRYDFLILSFLHFFSRTPCSPFTTASYDQDP